MARAIRRNRAGFDEGDRPIGSFLFVGPTGVGKTELAKQLALDLFGNKDDIIRLDMSEYADRTAVSKLIGTTAGYVGYDDNGNTLTEKVRRNPYSIVLLDEIEKADPQVITLLLQVLDDGRLTDGQGNVVNFKNTIFIATSNAGYSNDAQPTADHTSLIKKLTPYFRPEFLNRVANFRPEPDVPHSARFAGSFRIGQSPYSGIDDRSGVLDRRPSGRRRLIQRQNPHRSFSISIIWPHARTRYINRTLSNLSTIVYY